MTKRFVMECGGKRSATPLLLDLAANFSLTRMPSKAASRFACRRTPYFSDPTVLIAHSIIPSLL